MHKFRSLFRCFSTLLALIAFSSNAYSECSSRFFSNTEKQVMSVYISYYGRVPDTAGLEFWDGQLIQQGSLDAIIQAFGNSDEFNRNFGNLDNETLINNLYQQAFNRDADTAGLAFYLDELNNNRITLQAIALTIVNGAQNSDDTIIKNRITASEHYLTNAQDADLDLTETQMDGLIASIDESENSVQQACTSIDSAIETALAEIEDDNSFFENNSCDNGQSNSSPIKKVGKLKGIGGLAYQSESVSAVSGIKKSVQGVTSLNGEFEFYEMCGEQSFTSFCLGVKKNCSVSEIASGIDIEGGSIGARILGRVLASETTINVNSIVAQTYPNLSSADQSTIATNIYQLLLSLDIDVNDQNGILLNSRVRTEGELYADGIDFTDDGFDTDQSVLGYITAVSDTPELATEEKAKSFAENLDNVVESFSVSGKVLGTFSGLVITLNGSETLTLSSSNFTFETQLNSGEAYSIELVSEPVDSMCSISNGSGTISDSNISNISITCQSDAAIPLKVSVEGATSEVGLSLNDGPTVLFENGTDQFPTLLEAGSSYSVFLTASPQEQSCTLENNIGEIDPSTENTVSVTCTSTNNGVFTIGGSIFGADGDIGLRLNNGVAAIFGNGSFTFEQTLGNGDTYNVTLIGAPDGQQCTLENNAGTISGQSITDVSILCEDIIPTEHTVSGNAAGLTNTIELTLNDNSVLLVSSDGSFTFPDILVTGTTYSVSVSDQPIDLSCSITNGSGTIENADITNVQVNCVTIEPEFTIGGTVTGAIGTVLVTLNDDVTLVSNGGDFTYPTTFPNGDDYLVTVESLDSGQQCSIENASGTIAGANITDIIVTCIEIGTPPDTFTVGGIFSGILDPVTLKLNDDELLTTEPGNFVFATAFLNGSTYSVSITSQPTDAICSISNNSGIISGASITSVTVECELVQNFSVNVNVSGAIEPISLNLNEIESAIVDNGAFTFDTPLADGNDYVVTLDDDGDTQTCTVENGTGTINGQNAEVSILCVEDDLVIETQDLDGLGTDLNPATIDAGLGNFKYLDSYSIGNNIVISNFDAGDEIVFSGISESVVASGFSTNGTDARVTLNNNGIVSEVVFQNVGGNVFTIQQFNAQGGGLISVQP